jgi:hypothetical protein
MEITMAGGLWSFVITCVGLALIVGLIWVAIAMLEVDEGFKNIARLAVGGLALLIFLIAVGAALGLGGSGMVAISPVALIEFAIGLIVVLVVIYIAKLVITRFGVMVTEINYVLAAVALIVILIMAGKALFGGGLGFIPSGSFGSSGKRSDSVPYISAPASIIQAERR